VRLVGWPTVTKSLADKGVQSGPGAVTEAMRTNGADFAAMVPLTSWATPALRDWRSNSATQEHHNKRAAETRGKPLSEQAHQLSGPMPTGSGAEMENIGQLNPAHSRWLMGFPAEWDSCGATAMQSFRKSPRRLSKRTKTRG